MTDTIITAAAYTLFAFGTVTSLVFICMMIADDFNNPNKETKHK